MAEGKTKRISAKHKVDLALTVSDIAKAGAAVTFKVRGKNGLLGTIEIGQGSFGWKAANKQTFKRIAWTDFTSKLNEGM